MNKNYLALAMGRVRHIHFVGIGGSGMCGIAEVLHNQGYIISGSDLQQSSVTERLASLGITIIIGHQAQNIIDADVIVRSTAVSEDNPEIIAARQAMIPVIPRAMMLAELMRFRYGIAIAGTHGKTTTTSLVSTLLATAGFDPGFVIGGKLNSMGKNAEPGTSPYFVVEADESDASFLFLQPMMAVVTNIDADHMSTYDEDFGKLRAAFVEFLHHLPFYGLAVLCIDDEEVRNILPQIERRIVTCGFHADAQYRVVNWRQKGLVSEFTVLRPEGHQNLQVTFSWPGRHNVLNALAAIVIATELGAKDEAILSGLAGFAGVGRRFQMLGECNFNHGNALVIDDYGHHPREIISTIDAFRTAWPDRRLIHVFQPHRYTRTESLFAQFVEALSNADELLLMDIYAAGEQSINGATSDDLASAIRARDVRVNLVTENNLEQCLNEIVTNGDIILMQGAGNIGQLALKLAQNYREPV